MSPFSLLASSNPVAFDLGEPLGAPIVGFHQNCPFRATVVGRALERVLVHVGLSGKWDFADLNALAGHIKRL